MFQLTLFKLVTDTFYHHDSITWQSLSSANRVKPKFVNQQNSLLSYVFGAICEHGIVLPVPPLLRIKTKQFHVCNLYKTCQLAKQFDCKTSQAKQFSEGVVAKPIEYYILLPATYLLPSGCS